MDTRDQRPLGEGLSKERQSGVEELECGQGGTRQGGWSWADNVTALCAYLRATNDEDDVIVRDGLQVVWLVRCERRSGKQNTFLVKNDKKKLLANLSNRDLSRTEATWLSRPQATTLTN